MAEPALAGARLRAVLLRRLACLHAGCGRGCEAVGCLDQALAETPGDVDALLLRARLLSLAGEHERAFLDVRTLHSVAPAEARSDVLWCLSSSPLLSPF